MSRREDIDNAIWSDPGFIERSANAKLLYLWSFTNPRCGMAGIYKLSLLLAELDLSMPLADVSAAIDELSAVGLLHYENDVMWVTARVKHLRSRTVQIARSIANDVEKIPEDHPLRVRFMERYADDPWLREQLLILAPALGWGVATYVTKARRAAIYERDGYRCIDCGTTEDLSIDHRTPRTHGGDNSEGNLVTRCRGCNSRKGPTGDSAQTAGFSEAPIRGSNQEVVDGGSDRSLQGLGLGNGKKNSNASPRDLIDFEEWLLHHEQTTGHTAPRTGTKARAAIVEAFGARQAEGYPLADLKLATVGAHEDEYRRTNGYDTAESVLRPTKVAALIARGRLRGGGGPRRTDVAGDLDRAYGRTAG